MFTLDYNDGGYSLVNRMKKRLKSNIPEEIITAIIRNDFKLIKEWCSPSTVNLHDGDNRSIIFLAIIFNSIDLVSLLLEQKPNLNIKDSIGWYPLHYAAQNYLPKIVEGLLKHGALTEMKDDYGNTPLWRATFSSAGKGEVINLLLASGADPYAPNDAGITPHQLAQTIANYDVKQFFI